MSAYWTKHTAAVCAFNMHVAGYQPKAIFNAGVGSWPEFDIWRWLYPDIVLLGIDPVRRYLGIERCMPNAKMVNALLGSRVGNKARYCLACRSAKCSSTAHDQHSVQLETKTLDSLSDGIPGPYFVWIDVEGSEIDVLDGAEKTLKQAAWVNIEVQNYGKMDDHAAKIRQWMTDHRFRPKFQHRRAYDVLYYRPIVSEL